MPLCGLGASGVPRYFDDVFVELWNHLAATILEVRIFIWLFLKLESVFSDYLKRLHINTLFLFFNLILSFLFGIFLRYFKVEI